MIGTGTRTVREGAFELLRERGMTTIFGNPGSTELGLLRDLPPDFRYVMALHESVAVAMADGYAQAAGRPAFVNLHSACGVGNAMGAVVNAFHNRAPLVITGGNQDRRHLALEPYLFARGVELMAPYVKHAEQPARAQDVPAALDRAWVLAQARPYGPVFVSVPADDWDAGLPAASPSAIARHVRAAGGLDAGAVAELARRLSDGVVALIVGAGVDRDGAWAETTELAERLDAAVWAAPQAPRLGFPEDHPLYRGHLAAGYGSAVAQLDGVDVALVLGAPVFAFLPYEPSDESLPAILHITDDPDEAARGPSELSLIGDTRAIVDALLERIPPRPASERAPRAAPAMPPTSEPISPAFLMATLARTLPNDAVLVEESPSNRNDLRRHLWIRRPASFFATASGGLGFAMPAAVGIKLAQPGRPVICLVGDGSALFAPQALWSAVQLGIPVTFIVVNNARYAILESVAAFGGLEGLPSLELPGVDLLAMAATYGCPAARVRDPGELPDAIRTALQSDGPVLLDVVVERTVPPLLPARRIDI
ncbi:MAG TPA: benzoylformate decarboxylase [Solirubrobacteraceae bacterium]|nr:benzoylformate decarboxylase [Solirubrobacteraceae bacterium]HUA71992.1 benzoylformate decarboxylase [Solirubrobacteraceae bacterium]